MTTIPTITPDVQAKAKTLRQELNANHIGVNLSGKGKIMKTGNDILATALQKMFDAGQQQQWQPIETLLDSVKESREQVVLLLPEWCGPYRARVDKWKDTGFTAGWEQIMSGYRPTHWMPLPKPPDGAK